MADKARNAGAAIVGEDDLLASIKAGEINFDRLLCVRQSAAKLNTANVGRILGPKGLMPSIKQGTMIDDIARAIRGMVGGSEYREKLGVIRLAIGQLAFSPEQLQRNIKALMTNVNKDAREMSDKIAKEIHEVVSFPHYPSHPHSPLPPPFCFVKFAPSNPITPLQPASLRFCPSVFLTLHATSLTSLPSLIGPFLHPRPWLQPKWRTQRRQLNTHQPFDFSDFLKIPILEYFQCALYNLLIRRNGIHPETTI